MDYYGIFIAFIDIFISSVIIYQIFKFIIKSEKMIFVINAIIMILVLYALAISLGLTIVTNLLSNIFSWWIVLVFILFQSEIKRSLEKLGDTTKKKKKTASEEFIDNFIDSLYILAADKTGALITFEMDMSLDKYTEKAIKLNAEYSQQLFLTIFNKESNIHDGAIVIKNEIITYASTYYPISLDLILDKKYGTRHRSALTISSETDSLTILVSEERGTISIAYKGNLYEELEREFVKAFLTNKLKG